jgi:malate/lactate dehydrogenase
MGFGEVSLSLPAVISRNGVARVLSVPLSAYERKALEASAQTLKNYIAALNAPENALL